MHRSTVLPDGRVIETWLLTGQGGMELECLTLGGIVTALRVPTRSGKKIDVVLGLDSPVDYAKGHPYFGAIIGRQAGRVRGASFLLDGRRIALSENEPPQHLHGGFEGFDKRIWQAEPMVSNDGGCSLQLSYVSPDGEEGYPGEVCARVVYTLTPDNGFVIETLVESAVPTPVNLTHHSYFHLGGAGNGDALDHELEIRASHFVPYDETRCPIGQLLPVCPENDFRVRRSVRDALPGLVDSHGDLYFLDPSEGAPVALVDHAGTGLRMEVFTDNRFLQFYTGASLDGSILGKGGQRYPRFGGLCFEAEGYPDGANCPQLDDLIVRPGCPQERFTRYQFKNLI